MKPSPTWFGTTWLSRIHFLPSGTATVSASRLCISTTSTPRSRILFMKSKWSRLAFSTHRTSSNSSASQLLRRKALVRAARRADHHLAQLADLGVDAEFDFACSRILAIAGLLGFVLDVHRAIRIHQMVR